MADRTLTINHADGGSETYTINRDKFAGVRDMVIDGANVSVDHTAVPKEQSKETTFGGSQSITVNRDIEPLLSKVVGGAAAAYSLRDLNDSQGNNNVVRVRRESDNSEKDFRAKEVSNGTMARWVNEQPTLPLDLRELDTNTGERDGALIEAAAAYSLRKLKKDFTGDVVEVRRNVDGETEGFTADEVTDGTLESFVNASFNDELPLDQATGAAAAYSLRNLSSSFTGDVVEVRRSSDDAVQSFTASEVANGTLEDWVNADVDKLDLGAKAADGGLSGNYTSGTDSADFSVSNEGSTGYGYLLDNSDVGAGSYEITFDVVLNSGSLSGITIVINDPTNYQYQNIVSGSNSFSGTIDNTGSIFFRTSSTSVADVSITNITLTQTTADGFVRTWYDQSGSDNHAVQATPANQPKIVEGGTYLEEVDFNGTSHYLDLSSPLSSTTEAAVFTVAESGGGTDNLILDNRDGGTDGFRLFKFGPDLQFRWQSAVVDTATAISSDTKFLGFANHDSSNASAAINGATANSVADTSSINVAATPRIGARSFTSPSGYWDGTINELIIYNSDQSTKRRAIEENIANHYDITLAAFSRDGTVSTWYDQSGNTNDATQTDPTNQPKIVDAGTLQKDSRNNPAIVFDDVDDNMDLTSDLVAGGAYSAIAYHEFNSASMILKGNLNVPRIRLTSVTNYQIGSYSPSVTQDFAVVSSQGLVSVLKDASHNARVYANGTESSSGQQNVGSGSSPFTMLGTETNNGAANGKLVEVIYYESDQSDNRTAIEANIGEHYGITDIPAADDTVNGFVQTWYDQSGNGNDAVQGAASSQPKIVDGGTLVADGIDFDGSSHFFDIDFGSNLSQPNSFFLSHTADTTNSALNEYFDTASGTPRTLLDIGAGYRLFSGVILDSGFIMETNRVLFSAFANSTSSFVCKNGVSSTVGDAGTDGINQFSYLGRSDTRYYDGSMDEFIIYNSDQSSNRPAIEANIANQYGITLS